MSFLDKILGGKNAKSKSADKENPWKDFSTEEQLTAIIEQSNDKPCLIFKHSTRCSISSVAKSRLERDWDIAADVVSPYYLDLIAYRSVSDKIAEVLHVEHQSPQVILIKDGKAIYDASHNAISVAAIKAVIS